MCRTPSPLKQIERDDDFSLTKIWSPGLGTNRKSPKRNGATGKRASELSETVVGIPEEPMDSPSREEFDDEEKFRIGNWI